MLCTPPPPKARGGPVYYSQRINVIQLYVSKKDQLSVYIPGQIPCSIYSILCRSSLLYISVTHIRIYPTNATKWVLLKLACRGVTCLVYIYIISLFFRKTNLDRFLGSLLQKCNHLFCIGMTHMIHYYSWHPTLKMQPCMRDVQDQINLFHAVMLINWSSERDVFNCSLTDSRCIL